MKRSLVFAGLWVLAFVAIVLLAFGGTQDLDHAYLAAWLVLVSLPLGALAVLMLLQLVDRGDVAIAGPLRLLLATLPVMAILFVPVLFKSGALYGWPDTAALPPRSSHGASLADDWFTPFWFGVRAVVAFAVWIVLSLYFLRPVPPSAQRRRLAAIGLLLHLVLGTVTAYDWYMSLDQGFVSSVYGILVMTSQGVFALTVAMGLSLLDEPGTAPQKGIVPALAVALLAVIYVQFSQYLVVWSANLPKEIVWYQTRWRDAAGPALVYGGPILVVLGCAILLLPLRAARGKSVLLALGALVIAEGLDLAALASPRDTFTLPDLGLAGLFVILIAGLAAASARALGHRETRQVRHG